METAAIALTLLSAGLIGVAAGLLLSWRIVLPKRPASARGGETGSPRDLSAGLSIIIPARNEERDLATLLASLPSSGAAHEVEVLVVDDESQDGTAEIASSFGFRVIAAGKRPRGWTGKSWACWQGALAASGSLLLFLDADTVLEPCGLSRLLALRSARGGLVSLQPYHRVGTAIERLSSLFNVVVMAATGAFTPWAGRGPVDGAFGPCMLIGRAEYFLAGGHRAVRNSLIEDMALGRACRSRSIPVTLDAGRGIIVYRMYPGGLHEIIEGWTKNLSAGARSAPRMISTLLGLWLAGSLATVLLAVLAVAVATAGSLTSLIAWAAIGGYLLICSQLGWTLARIGSFGIVPAIAFPVHLLFFLMVFFRSLYLHRVRKEVQWKGRRVEVEGKW